MVGNQSGRPDRVVPALLVGVSVAVLVAAVGLAARPTLHLPRHAGVNPHSGRDLALTVVAVIAGFVLMARAGRLAARYQRVTYRLVGVALIVGPVVAVNPIQRLRESNRRPAPGPTRSPPLDQPSGSAHHGVASWFGFDDLVVLIVGPLALAGLALVGYLVMRTLRRPDQHVIPAGIGRRALDEAADVLGRAAGAMRLGANARDRVIAAYEAMESALLDRGATRTAQQAPLEWLAELADSHPHTVGPARELTEIFERARFSTAPVSDDDAHRAGAALERLRATLAGMP